MIRRSLSIKNRKKLEGTKSKTSTKKELPDNWYDFACLCDIRSGASIIKFIPYKYQQTLIEQVEKHCTTIITKGRQLGLTETIANYFLFKAVTNEGYLGVIFSKTQADTSNIARRIRRQIDSLYEYVETRTDSLTDIEFSHGGRLLFRNSTPNGSRGLESVSDILFDEAAFVDEIEEIYKSAIPCTTAVGEDARIIILSTPSGQSGWYFDKLSLNNGDRDILNICQQVREGLIDPVQYWSDNNGWCKFIVHWKAHPVYALQQDTYLQSIKARFELPEDVIQQEYNLSFTDSDTLVFSSDVIRKNAIASYEDSLPEAIYYMGIDTSLLGNDYTVVTVLKENGDRYELVKLYRERKKTHEYNLYRIGELVEQFQPIKVAIEVNSSGQIYYEKLSNEHLNVDFEAIKTTGSSKPKMINRLSLSLEKGLITYPNDKVIIEEFLSFRQNGIKLEAIQGKHDDIIMSLAFAVTVLPLD